MNPTSGPDSKGQQLREWIFLAPALLSLGAVFVFLSAVYYSGFSMELSRLVGTVGIHQFLSISDYTAAAIALFSNPAILLSMVFVLRCLQIFAGLAGQEPRPDSPGHAKFTGKPGRILVVSLVAVVVTAGMYAGHRLVPDPFRQLLALLLGLSVLLALVYYSFFWFLDMIMELAKVDGSADKSRYRQGIMRRIAIAGVCLALVTAIVWSFLGFLSQLWQPAGFAFISLATVTFLCFWVPLIDKSCGYTPFRSFSADPWRSLIAFTPLVLAPYWATGITHVHDMVHHNSASHVVMTKSFGAIQADWYMVFDKWVLVACKSENASRSIWIPAHELTGVGRAGSQDRLSRQVMAPCEQALSTSGTSSTVSGP